MKFTISDDDGPKIPADDGVSRTYGVVGQRGTGKSTAAAVLVEGFVHAGARVVPPLDAALSRLAQEHVAGLRLP